MSKYAPLADFLRSRETRETPVTFAELERILGFPLPPKAQHHPAWWSNNPSNNTMTKVWLQAGFKTERVDIASRRLVFVKASPKKNDDAGHSLPAFQPQPGLSRHPALGAMKGTVRIMPGVDLTEPADPDWADIAEHADLPGGPRP